MKKKAIFVGILLSLLIAITMGLFDFFRKKETLGQTEIRPYKDDATDLIYNLLFCDNLSLFKDNTEPSEYPYDILFSETSSGTELQRIIEDTVLDTRLRILAYNKQLASGYKQENKELLAVIVEVGLDNGLDVLASFKDGTARYINQTGKMLIWETKEKVVIDLTDDLFSKSQEIVNQIGVWDKPRRPAPVKGNVRITFLVSDGIYFGEGPIDVLFTDSLAGPALMSATLLMKHITETSLEFNN